MPAGVFTLDRPVFDPVVLIPVYNHGVSAVRMIGIIRAQGLPCIVVDDGSDTACQQQLEVLRDKPGVQLLRHPVNKGKGAAVMAGLRAAQSLGHTHAVQIDADGQHDPAAIPQFLDLSSAHPHAVICGVPAYDSSAPLGRVIGRYATHVWVWINTLSLTISDSMCGFRVYPLTETIKVLDETVIGAHMEFDIEILVRLYWCGTAILNLSTPVTYPDGGVSHFKMWRDNVRISRMHARLFFGMLQRAPRLVARRFRES